MAADQSRSGESDDGQRDDHPSEDDANELNEEELWNKQQAPSEAVVITSIVFTDPHLLVVLAPPFLTLILNVTF